jgi:cation-transporting ATPase E
VFTLFNGLLAICFCLVMLAGSPGDSLFAIVIFINMIIGVTVEIKAKKALDKLSILVVSKVKVLKENIDDYDEYDFAKIDNLIENRDLESVLVGDVIYLLAGDQIPVDGQLLFSRGLEADESMLTGESDTVKKNSGDKVLSGSIVIAGSAICKAEAVGANSYAQKITQVAKTYKPIKSDLVDGINKILKYISFGILPVAALLLFSQARELGSFGEIFNNGEWKIAIVQATAGIVGMIPEGLVLLTSFNFALAAIILAKKRVIIQEPPAVEALARIDSLCLDKTGTLTDGTIAVDNIITFSKSINDTFKVLSKIIKSITKNATSLALEKYLLEKHSEIFNLAASEKSENVIQFSSIRKYSGIKDNSDTYLLGAPEFIIDENSESNMPDLSEFLDAGKRVLALSCNKKLEALIICSENIRSDARETLEYFYSEGVNPIIISGDNPKSVQAVSERAGLRDAKCFDAVNLPSDDAKAEKEQIQKIVSEYNVFGRVLPEQKKALIRALQANGSTVAMTGDGVNDVLALKESDLSIVMGNGASAAKSISHIVLGDSHFSHLPSVLGQGRRVMANMERVSSLFLTKTFSSILLVLATVIAMEPYPLLPRHLTAISALTIGIPSFFLALPPNNTKYEYGFLKRVIKFSFPAGAVLAFLVFASFTIAGLYLPKEMASTYAVIAGLAASFGVLIIKSRPLKSWRAVLILALIILAISIFFIPVAYDFFQLSLF